MFYYGGESLLCSTLQEFLQDFATTVSGDSISRLLDQQRAYATKDSEDLLTTVMRHQIFQCTDPRDKIFAMLGLVEPAKRYGIVADYSLPLKDLFLTFTVKSIQQRQDLDVLSAATSNSLPGHADWPSWVLRPDRDLNTDVAFPCFFSTRSARFGCATSRQSRWNCIVSPDSLSLDLEGVHFDVVDAVGPYHQGWQGGWPYGLRVFRWVFTRGMLFIACYSEWRQLASVDQTQNYHLTGKSRLEAFRQVYMGGIEDNAYNECINAREFLDRHTWFVWGGPKTMPKSTTGKVVLSLAQTTLWLFTWARSRDLVFLIQHCHIAFNRRFFLTKTGAMGLGPRAMQSGDEVVIFKGGKVPLIVRPAAGTGTLTLVGEAYVHVIMHGEAFDKSRCKPYSIV
jgi:hypothetical protein